MAETSVNYSLKLSPETKDALLNKISESNQTAGEFIASLLATYEAAQGQESLFDVRELQQMENHLIRVKEIYIALGRRLRDEENSHQLTKEKSQEEIRLALTDTMTAKETAEKELETAKSRIAELEAELKNAEEFARQNGSMASASTQIINAQKQQIEDLKNEVAKLKSEHSLAKSPNSTGQIIQSEQSGSEFPSLETSEIPKLEQLENTAAIPPASETATGESPNGQAATVPPPAPPKAKPKKKNEKAAATVADSQPRADGRPADDTGEENI